MHPRQLSLSGCETVLDHLRYAVSSLTALIARNCTVNFEIVPVRASESPYHGGTREP